MKIGFFSLLPFLFITGISAFAQETDRPDVKTLDQSFTDLYGPDQNLVSGVRYYNLHARYDGHKYFEEDRFTEGKLFLHRGTYPDVRLKYDLYEQQVILQVNVGNGSYNEIIVTDSRLEGFEMNGKTFRKEYFPDMDTLIFQVIGTHPPYCLIHWTKEVIPNSTGPQSVYEFSKMKRKTYVRTDSILIPYRGSSSFAKVFPDHRSQVKSYLRKNKIRIRKASDQELEGLLDYCRSLLNKEGKP